MKINCSIQFCSNKIAQINKDILYHRNLYLLFRHVGHVDESAHRVNLPSQFEGKPV